MISVQHLLLLLSHVVHVKSEFQYSLQGKIQSDDESTPLAYFWGLCSKVQTERLCTVKGFHVSRVYSFMDIIISTSYILNDYAKAQTIEFGCSIFWVWKDARGPQWRCVDLGRHRQWYTLAAGHDAGNDGAGRVCLKFPGGTIGSCLGALRNCLEVLKVSKRWHGDMVRMQWK